MRSYGGTAFDSRDCAAPHCPEEAEPGRELCRWCAQAAPPPPRPSGRARITDDELRALHDRYRAGESISSLGRAMASRFASDASATQCIRIGWRRLGLPRDMPRPKPVRHRTGGMRRPEQPITAGQPRPDEPPPPAPVGLPEEPRPRSFLDRLDELEERVTRLEQAAAS